MSSILIVDDNERNRYLLRAMLAGHGYDVMEASNGSEALASARKQPPDLIVSDILMPQMDGFTLCREWQKDANLRRIPFVFYTATYTDRRDEELALKLGAARFFVKPVDDAVFLSTIREVAASSAAGELRPAAPADQEPAIYKMYNAALIRKLEEKMEALAESEGRFRRLAENAPDMIYRYEIFPERRVSYVSPAATALTGYQPTEFYENPEIGEKLVHPDESPEAKASLWGHNSRQNPVTMRWLSKDGRCIWIEQRHVPVTDRAGRPVAFEGIIRDITNRVTAEREKEQLQSRLYQAQKMESIGHLAASIAHDFNNMINVILGYSELALEKMPAGDPLRTHLNEVVQAAHRSAEITRQLLVFARRQPGSPVVLKLNESIAATLGILKKLIRENVELVWRPRAIRDEVSLDPAQLDQILTNLCANARDAISGAGRVCIETENVSVREEDRQDYPCPPGDYVMLSVKDNGCGMDEATRDRIFEPFFTTKPEGRGTGLGLATVYGIVSQHQGYIDVRTRPGKGAEFRIFLPCHVAERPDSSTTPAAPPPHGRGETVLVVEDEKPFLQLVRKMLENLGYTAVTTTSPEEALRLAREKPGSFAVVLADVVMPEMSGPELASRLKEIDPDAKIAFMSGYSSDFAKNGACIPAGAAYLEKPFSQKQLGALIAGILGRKS